jgi:hypothetical protein
MAKLAALLLGISWLLLAIVMLLSATLLLSIFILPCETDAVSCAEIVTRDFLLNTFQQDSIIRIFQLLAVTLMLFGFCAVVVSRQMLIFAVWRSRQYSAVTGFGFGILVVTFCLFTLSGISRAQSWTRWVRLGCPYSAPNSLDSAGSLTFYRCASAAQDCEPVTQLGILRSLDSGSAAEDFSPVLEPYCPVIASLSCRLPDSYAHDPGLSAICSTEIQHNRAPHTHLTNTFYDPNLNQARTYTLSLLLISAVFSPMLLTASPQPPRHLQYRTFGMCSECGFAPDMGKAPTCSLCQPLFKMDLENTDAIFDFENPLIIPITIRLYPADIHMPLRQIQLRVTLPGPLEYAGCDNPLWSRRAGRHILLDSPAIFFPVLHKSDDSTGAFSKLTFHIRVRESVLRQRWPTIPYKIIVTSKILDGLSRPSVTKSTLIKLRRPPNRLEKVLVAIRGRLIRG